jgi:hypothetical protein
MPDTDLITQTAAAGVAGSEDTLELGEALEILREADPSSAISRRCRALLDAKLEVRHPIPPATKRREEKFFTIGTAVYDDYDGLYFTIQAIRLYHPEILDHVEFLVIDNNPTGRCAQPLKDLESWIPNYRYFPYPYGHGPAVRDLIFREAVGEFVLSIDCHVFFPAGALAGLINYCWGHRDTGDLLQGPLLRDDLTLATHLDPVWREGRIFCGHWGLDPRGSDAGAAPFEIGMMGLGAFACRRGAWPGLNPRLNGFGGEEGYLHERFRRNGARCLCLPFFRWTHRFQRPMGVPYPLTDEDRVRNYLIAYEELGWDPEPVIRHLEKCAGEVKARSLVEPVQAEIASPFHVFDEAWCINLDSQTERWEAALRRFRKVGIASKVRRFAAAATPLNHHIGCALSHRRIIEQARLRNLETVLVFEDDVRFTADAAEVLRLALRELEGFDWQILYLGGCRWEPPVPIPGCQHLLRPKATTCLQSLVYHRSVYDRILDAVPDNAVDVALWLRDNVAIDQFFAFGLDACLLLMEPVIATQPNLMDRETRQFDE